MPVQFEECDFDTCTSMQKEEYEVLESIYPDFLANDISDGTLKLEIPIELVHSTSVTVIDDGSTSGSSSSVPKSSTQVSSIALAHLPPIFLHLVLPPNYPLQHPPNILLVGATHSWLPRLDILKAQLLDMWRTGNVILYDWIEYVRNAEFLDVSLRSPEGDLIQIPHPAPHLLIPLLINYDTRRQSDKFSHNTFTCSICFSGYKGKRCIQLLCLHVFCRSCLTDFWKLCIMEGDIRKVGCPDPECVRASREAEEEEVTRVVSEEEFQRWRWLREKRRIEKDPTMVHCPMTFCQAPVTKSENDGYERLRTCSSCGWSFCSLCKRAWHGPHSACPISSVENVVAEYVSLPVDSPLREEMERQYGSAMIAKLVAIYEEEQKNKQWISSCTMACPGCSVNVEKSRGCNHMTCSKCMQHFCYRCGVKLDPSDPYEHFSTRGLRCYSKLFDYEED